jgi:hypothetical protein
MTQIAKQVFFAMSLRFIDLEANSVWQGVF